MKRALTVLAALALTSCRPAHPPEPLFGTPLERTGLSSADCQPTCAWCDGGVWRELDEEQISALTSAWTQTSPSAPLEVDPYDLPVDERSEGEVCALVRLDGGTSPRAYVLNTYESETAAQTAGAVITHFDACGVCSSLENLAVYLRNPDLGSSVRACGLRSGKDGQSDFDADLDCLRGLGFDLPCAQIWAFNTRHTRAKCLSVCLGEFDAPYNRPDGTLNGCLQCDEDESGPVFKAVAGRTRRNSGIPNAICRPCREVRVLEHRY